MIQQRKIGACRRVPGCANKNVSALWSAFLLLCPTPHRATGDHPL